MIVNTVYLVLFLSTVTLMMSKHNSMLIMRQGEQRRQQEYNAVLRAMPF